MPDRPADHSVNPSTDRAAARSPLLTAVALVVAVEVLLLLAGAGYLLHGLLVEEALAPVGAAALAASAVLFAVGLGVCCRGLLQRATWARSPVLVWQVLQLAAGWPALDGGAAWLGVLLVVSAVLVVVGSFLPPVATQLSR